MRVTVYLGLYFQDHRSLARIFINKKMKYIKDVEFHISGIFNITNFYLKCENHYLPPTEDIQILKEDDILWAIPTAQNITDTAANGSINYKQPTNSDEMVEKKRKKKKKKDLENADLDGAIKVKRRKSVCSDIEEIEKRIHNQKNEYKLSENSEDLMEIEQGEVLAKKEKNKKRKAKQNLIISEKCTTAGQSELSMLNNNFNHERKVNIVKTIIVSSGMTEKDNSKCEPTESAKQNYDLNNVKTDNIVNGNLSDAKNCNSVFVNYGNFENGNLSDVTESSFSYNASSELSTITNKRKRKRTRKRKNRSAEVKKEFDSNFAQPVWNIKQTPAETSTHLRFIDEEVVAIDKATTINENSVNENELKSVFEETVQEDKKSEDTEEEVLEAYLKSNNKDIEECILKQPVTINSEPRKGDVIAFKILRISENYTPEVSATIIGKVINYKPDSKEITFDIVYGREQCIMPKGKFSLDQDQEEQPLEVDSNFRCLWPSLLEPRLLFP